jgi:hypothetical protein
VEAEVVAAAEVVQELRSAPLEGQIGAVDGLLRFRTCVSGAIGIEARHGAARLVRAA